MPSAFSQIFLNSENALFCAFEGALQNINLNTWEVAYKNNVKKLVKSKKMENYFTNPPYVHKILYNKKISENIFIALMNGTILSIDKFCKKNLAKNAYTCNILDLKYFRNDTLITLGKDYVVKFMDLNNQLKTKFYLELEEPAAYIETWDNNFGNSLERKIEGINLEDKVNNDNDKGNGNDIGFNYRNEIYYIDPKSTYLRILNINF